MLSFMQPMRSKLDTYAITISTFLQNRHFQREANTELFLNTLLRYQAQGKFQLHGFAIMPTHAHLLITPAVDQPTSRSVQLIKGGYSFAARDQQKKEIWHSGHHEHRVRDLMDYENQLRYIANNPPEDHLPSDYRYVHTHPSHASIIDPCPPHFLR
jgi:putative transposase